MKKVFIITIKESRIYIVSKLNSKITSLQNPLVKECVMLHQKKYRDKTGLMLLEGQKALEAAKEAGLEIKHVFDHHSADEKVMAKISTTQSPPKVAAIAKKPVCNLEDFKKYKKIALFDGIKDAGNLGAIIRSAAAFGIEGILLYGDCTDAFSPKVLRASAGNMFKLSVCEISPEELKNFKKTHALISTVVNSSKTPSQADFARPFILMFGSEASGLCEELLNISDTKITLKMLNSVESLNLAVSASILFYEISLKY